MTEMSRYKGLNHRLRVCFSWRTPFPVLHLCDNVQLIGGWDMTTIITVHGTNAGDESDTGEQWWQQKSEFQEKLSEYVEAPDGRLEFKPFHWGVGPNSELKRRDAGNDLRREMLALEKEEVPYSVIGHSHGGSVLNHALFSVYAKKLSLPNMKSWVTVGTPFIETRRSGFFLTRFNLLGQIGLAIALVQILSLISQPLVDYYVAGNFEAWDSTSLGASLLLLAAVFIIASAFTARARKRQDSIHQRQFADKFESRLSSFRHSNDEAIEGLKNVKSLRANILKAYPIARGLSAFIAILLTFIWAVYNVFFSIADANLLIGNIESIQEMCGGNEVCIAIDSGISAIEPLVYFAVNDFTPSYLYISFVYPLSLILLIFLVYGVSLFCLTALLIPVVAILNLALSSQVRSISVGGDAFGERLNIIRSQPNSDYSDHSQLPHQLAQEIEDYTEQYAIDAIRKIRALIGSNIASSDNPITDQISDTLSWKELIHTAYFDVDNFIKLVAVSLCESGLVTPSRKLKSDPEYDKVVGWYQEMKPEA